MAWGHCAKVGNASHVGLVQAAKAKQAEVLARRSTVAQRLGHGQEVAALEELNLPRRPAPLRSRNHAPLPNERVQLAAAALPAIGAVRRPRAALEA